LRRSAPLTEPRSHRRILDHDALRREPRM
jgi:hypothetical protein